MQAIPKAFCLARANVGNSRPARMATMAITTSNSIKVKPLRGNNPGLEPEKNVIESEGFYREWSGLQKLPGRPQALLCQECSCSLFVQTKAFAGVVESARFILLN